MDNIRIYHLGEDANEIRMPFRVVPGHQKTVISQISKVPIALLGK